MSSNESPQPPCPAETHARRRRRRMPPKWVWIVLALLAILAAVLRGADVPEDHAFANITTVVGGVVPVP